MNLLPHLTRIARVSEKTSDADLLGGFVNRRDGDAFAALVRRHAGMIWNVCRRWLPNPADAEDAFQATFLVLVRRAATIDRPEQLTSWLYGVAIRASRKLRDRNLRLQRLHKQLPVNQLSGESTSDSDLNHVLDEELQRLPEKYRLPVILCHLRGMSRREAARLVGCPEGTLSTRIARAMALLRGRLIRRGLAPAVLATFAPAAAAAAPRLLVRSTVAIALCSSLSAVPSRVSQIAEGVIQMLFLQKVMRATVSAVVLVGVLLGGGLLLTNAVNLPASAGDTPAATAKPPAPPMLTVKIRCDDAGTLKQLVVAEDGDESTMTTTRALNRYLKRAKRERPALEVTVSATGKLRHDVMTSVLQTCRDGGFANCKIKAAEEAGFELVETTNYRVDLGLFQLAASQLNVQPMLDLSPTNRAQAVLMTDGSVRLPVSSLNLTAPHMMIQPDLRPFYLRTLLPGLNPGTSSLDGSWSVRRTIGASHMTTYDGAKNYAEWVITGEYVIDRKGDKYQVGRLHIEMKDGGGTIGYTPDAAKPESHRGTFTLNGDTLTMTFPGSVLSGGTDTIVLERKKADSKSDTPAPAKKPEPQKK